MTVTHELTEYRAVARAARNRGVSWLLEQQQGSGALLPENNTLSTYYKGPLALASVGESPAGQNLLNWVRKNALTETGDFQGSEGRGAQRYHASYPNAWIIVGAERIGDYGVSYQAIQHLLTRQDPDTGGFFRVLPDDVEVLHESEDDDPYAAGAVLGSIDLMNTSMAGFACLSTGHLEEARHAGDFIVRVQASQPRSEGKFYFQWKAGAGLITDFPDHEADAFVIDSAKTKQKYFQLGIAAAFLSRLHEATRDPAYLSSARGLIDFTERLGEDRYAIPASGKIGWGASYLYRLTGNERYRDIAEEVGRSLVSLQGTSGSWVEESTMSQRIEITAEFVTLLTEIETGLTGKPLKD